MMSIYTYVESPNSNLICCICRTPFTDPVTTQTCAHTFCKDCILRAIEHSVQCPVDRSPLGPGHLVPADPIVRSLVDELVVECVHRAEGCMYTCQRQLLPAHLLDSCSYREVACPEGKCSQTMLFKDSISHVHEADKGDGEVDSTNAREMDDRTPKKATVEAYLPSAPDAIDKSPETTTNTLAESRAASSTPTSQLSGPVASHTRIASLTEQNILLRHRVDTLESLLHNFKREMTAVKRALGPWFRVGEGRETVTSESGYFATELPVGAQPSSASTSNMTEGITLLERLSPYQHSLQHHPHAYQYPFPHTAPAPMPPADSLAPYFPDELDDTAPIHSARRPLPPAPTNMRTHRSSSSVEYMNSPAPGYDLHNPFPAPLAPLVAPLNLGTTLEGTLHGLRESVVGLAASVDSMGRRHEIALTNETTRMAEEVGGLRAGIHGLRMQIHAMMMDRNAQLTGRDGVGDDGNGQWMPLPAPPTRPFHAQQPSITKL